MAIKIKLYQHKRKDLQGKWYGRAVKAGEVTTKDLARIISHNNSVTESDVHAVIIALVKEMKNHLREGQTVVLDDFGRFHLTVQSDMLRRCRHRALEILSCRHGKKNVPAWPPRPDGHSRPSLKLKSKIMSIIYF